MPYFLSPKVIFGKGALKRLVPEIEGKGTKAAVIFVDLLVPRTITPTAAAPHISCLSLLWKSESYFCFPVLFYFGQRLPCVPLQIFPRLVGLSPFPISKPPVNH